MKYLNWLCGLAFLFGIIFIIYGWTQSWVSGCRTGECENIIIEHTVRQYAFIIGGVILLFVGTVIDAIIKLWRSQIS
ncbi:hypothetical protein [Neobacillus soli]|uniref:hypothetical protein n=1 Tax=Neobacillus soli TaxID=220688 RepID=UPI000825AEB5|nr:hypothetical protein [Neobacillus soli]